MIGGLVLAAGRGARFGGLKQLAELDGAPLLEHVLRAMAAAPLDRVVVVLGAAAERVIARVPLHGAEPIVCGRWAEGQSASLRSGLDGLADADADAVVVALGDQPRVSPLAVRRLLAARAPGVAAVRASYRGAPGHPVVLEREMLTPLAKVSGDIGAREQLRATPTRCIPCDDVAGGEDVDTRDQLEALRAAGASA